MLKQGLTQAPVSAPFPSETAEDEKQPPLEPPAMVEKVSSWALEPSEWDILLLSTAFKLLLFPS
jgi:hypothetical protein